MLRSIQPFVVRFANIIATVTGIDIEVVDASLLRVAGTGIYAEGVGKSIEEAGEVYRHALAGRETVYVEDPRSHPICKNCPALNNCRETLCLCTPIVLDGQVLGIIGMVCFTVHERVRVMVQKRVYIDFVQQMAEGIAREVRSQMRQTRASNMLDTLLQIVDSNHRGILVLNREGGVTYCNDTARQELGLEKGEQPKALIVKKTGDILSDMDEFEVQVDGRVGLIMGHLSPLTSEDPAYASVLVFDSLPRLTERLSAMTTATESTGGLSAIRGDSRPLRLLAKKVRQIARTSSTVLITGESGTGKELFARAVHAESDRADKPFIAVNCGAIPDALLESELFGYVRGAFTGASPSGRIGKFELAHSGVIFLDEIGSMPLYLQVKLLRVLQERSIIRLGSNRLVDIDVRVIAATNEDLPELIRQNMFRDDLYYRLNVIPLEVPPLRERREDIPILARYFLDKYCKRFGKPVGRLPDSVLELFGAYAWPGNVREFENVMEYLVNIMPGGSTVALSMLPQKIRQAVVQARASAPAASPPAFSAAPAATSGPAPVIPLETLEQEAIRNALALYGTDTKGKHEAAKALGIGMATLYRKIGGGPDRP